MALAAVEYPKMQMALGGYGQSYSSGEETFNCEGEDKCCISAFRFYFLFSCETFVTDLPLSKHFLILGLLPLGVHLVAR